MSPRKVFVVGQARSGTSWIRAILAHGPAVSGPESHIFPTLHRYLVREPVDDEWRDQLLAAFDEAADGRRMPRQGPHRWIDRSSFVALLDETVSSDRSGDSAAKFVIDAILTSYFSANGGVRAITSWRRRRGTCATPTPSSGGGPTPGSSRSCATGATCTCRCGPRPPSTAPAWAAGEALHDHIQHWAESVRIGRRLSSLPVAADRWLTVRYEDLSADPRREVTRMFEFIDVPSDDEFLDRVVAGTKHRTGPQPLRPPSRAGRCRRRVASPSSRPTTTVVVSASPSPSFGPLATTRRGESGADVSGLQGPDVAQHRAAAAIGPTLAFGGPDGSGHTQRLRRRTARPSREPPVSRSGASWSASPTSSHPTPPPPHPKMTAPKPVDF